MLACRKTSAKVTHPVMNYETIVFAAFEMEEMGITNTDCI